MHSTESHEAVDLSSIDISHVSAMGMSGGVIVILIFRDALIFMWA